MKKVDFEDYKIRLIDSLNYIEEKKIIEILNIFTNKIKRKKNIFVCGNGGSAAISNHYICDFLKLVRQKTKYKPKFLSLASSMETITAISNDFSYDKIFSYQLETLGEKDDVIILISSSGNSKNMIEVLKIAKKKRIFVISFTGFNGGYLKKNSNLSIHIPTKTFSIAEDAHHILMHHLMERLILKLNNTK